MNATTIKILILTEARLRLRRLSTLVTLLLVAALAWLMLADQSSGNTFIAVQNAKVLYTSSALALGSATMFSLVFGLAGFYLVRGRISEDVRSGASGVIASSTISNALFLLCRWLGGVGYLVVLAGAFMLSIMACHLFRGVGAINVFVYLETYGVILLPLIFFSVSCAVLFDGIAPLMGKLGDVIYFFLWIAQISILGSSEANATHQITSIMLFDFSGIVMTMQSLFAYLHTSNISMGYASFDPKLVPVTLTNDLWSGPMLLMRFASAAVASLILLPSFFLFHRYSPDKVKVSHARERRSPIAVLNQVLRPLSGLVQPLFPMAARLPGILGQALADVALTLTSSPAAILALILVLLSSIFVNLTMLPSVLLAALAYWGILVSDISTRDYMTGCEDMTGVVAGGAKQRYLRQLVATFMLGLLFTISIALRLAFHAPLLACALLVGLFSLSALASLLGRTSRSSRTFLALFLFWLYVATQVSNVPIIDVAGFNAVANSISITTQMIIAITALIFGYSYNRLAK
ncbi:hypothetical protein [Solimicrobium silvestre]|uniref:Uncharacterized protein n=1 Tax=Solimicrobium silvestre TaxID=2099400 RepID=A0A2S9GWP2_9BURK|nr:hypothetical protein [Solimicrobium silvestre]PRC92145.1 hypothetical protein S2091_3061 [Solimicrobium silvestre]